MPATATPASHAGSVRTDRSPWICDHCHRPILDLGCLEVFDPTATEPFVQPRARSETFSEAEARRATPDTSSAKSPRICSLKEMLAVEPVQRIAFRVSHARCDPHPDSHAYNIDCADIETAEAWLDTVHHLAGKRWMGLDDVRRALAFWRENRRRRS